MARPASCASRIQSQYSGDVAAISPECRIGVQNLQKPIAADDQGNRLAVLELFEEIEREAINI
jgi:hypothetical protein